MTLEQYLSRPNNKTLHSAFAERVGVSQVTITRYVRSERFPSPEMIDKIFEATGGKVKVADWYAQAAAKRAEDAAKMSEAAQ